MSETKLESRSIPKEGKASKGSNHQNLDQTINNNVTYFKVANRSDALKSNLIKLKVAFEKCSASVHEIDGFAKDYDFDDNTPGNGYRSFTSIFDSAIRETSIVCAQLIKRREKILFRADNYAKQVDQWTQIFESLSQIGEALIVLHKSNNKNNLFDDKEGFVNILTKTFETVNSKIFYGKHIGFMFCSSLRFIIEVIATSLPCYYNYYFKQQSTPVKILKFNNSFVKYFFNPESRAEKYVNACENSTVEFCQYFWFLHESRLYHTLPRLIADSVDVNKVFKVPTKPLQIYSEKFGKVVDIPIPKSHVGHKPVTCRLLSKKRRIGMIGENVKSNGAKPSPYLIFHVHGGGWAAQTSKSHETYLREWAVKLDVPILSIDYSLAPEAPFPRALEEVFYAYCWALKNPELVGSTGENIVFVGDSAGGNLNTGCLIKCIEHGIPKPKGLFNIYTPFWIGFNVTPAKFLSFSDPFLPFGFLSRLCKSYAQNVDEIEEPIEISQEDQVENKKRRVRYESYAEEFDIKVHNSYLLSPYLAPKEILSEFPPTRLLSTNMDPCLDDSVEFGKKLKALNVNVQLDVLSDLIHGFLYFTQLSKECHEGSMVCMERIRSLLEL